MKDGQKRGTAYWISRAAAVETLVGKKQVEIDRLTKALQSTDKQFGEDDEDKWTNREIHQVLRPLINEALKEKP